MAIILTGPRGNLAFWDATRKLGVVTARSVPFPHPVRCAFARLPSFAANGNHAPAGHEGAQTHAAALDFLKRVAFGG